jgi:5'-3' exonuclease
MAYLLGSDYTDGVKGIGIVNAMEIIDVFGSKSKESSDTKHKKGTETRPGSQSYEEGGFFAVEMSDSIETETRTESAVEERGVKYQLQKSLSPLEDFKEWLLTPYDFSSLKFLQPKKKKQDQDPLPLPLSESLDCDEKQTKVVCYLLLSSSCD